MALPELLSALIISGASRGPLLLLELEAALLATELLEAALEERLELDELLLNALELEDWLLLDRLLELEAVIELEEVLAVAPSLLLLMAVLLAVELMPALLLEETGCVGALLAGAEEETLEAPPVTELLEVCTGVDAWLLLEPAGSSSRELALDCCATLEEAPTGI